MSGLIATIASLVLASSLSFGVERADTANAVYDDSARPRAVEELDFSNFGPPPEADSPEDKLQGN